MSDEKMPVIHDEQTAEPEFVPPKQYVMPQVNFVPPPNYVRHPSEAELETMDPDDARVLYKGESTMLCCDLCDWVSPREGMDRHNQLAHKGKAKPLSEEQFLEKQRTERVPGRVWEPKVDEVEDIERKQAKKVKAKSKSKSK